jgi:hypothetical protein
VSQPPEEVLGFSDDSKGRMTFEYLTTKHRFGILNDNGETYGDKRESGRVGEENTFFHNMLMRLRNKQRWDQVSEHFISIRDFDSDKYSQVAEELRGEHDCTYPFNFRNRVLGQLISDQQPVLGRGAGARKYRHGDIRYVFVELS